MALARTASAAVNDVRNLIRLLPRVASKATTPLGVRMSGGIAAARPPAIRAEFGSARIIVLTTYASDAKAVRALKAGAVGYLLKSSVRKELLDTIRAIDAGHRRIPPEIARLE